MLNPSLYSSRKAALGKEWSVSELKELMIRETNEIRRHERAFDGASEENSYSPRALEGESNSVSDPKHDSRSHVLGDPIEQQ